MPLNPPEVGRLSVCSTTVLMQYQLPGADITLHVDGSRVDLGRAKSAWEVMDLPPGLQLRRDTSVLATQSLGGETSPPSIAMSVQGVGSSPSKPQPHPDSHIYACAGGVVLTGVTPGSSVEILSGSTLLGTEIAHDGGAAVKLSGPVPDSTPLTARVNTCGQPPVSVTLPVGDKPPIDQFERLPAPAFGSPLMECVEWVRIDQAVPCATIVLTRGDGSVHRQLIATTSWTFHLDRPLDDGEPLVLRQEFDRCNIGGEDRHATVGPLVVKPPTLSSSWCAGRVAAVDLVPGATLIFFGSNGIEIGRSGVIGPTGHFTVVQPQAPRIFARQELCGVPSEPSNSVEALTDADLVDLTRPRPVILEPVLACQTELTVRGLRPGGLVQVFSDDRGLIGWRQAIAEETTVTVASLLPGESVLAHAISCAGQAGDSPPAQALDVPDVHPPRVAAPLRPGQKTVQVIDVQVGARLDVSVNGAFAAGTTVTSNPAEVNLPQALQLGQLVRARQGICGVWRSDVEGTPVTPAPVPTPPPAVGLSKVVVSNCSTENHTIRVWNFDLTSGTKNEVGVLPSQRDDWGFCPGIGAPLEVKLTDGHLHKIVFVDPDAIGCEGQNDPLVVACVRDSFPQVGAVKGLNSGPAFPYAVA